MACITGKPYLTVKFSSINMISESGNAQGIKQEQRHSSQNGQGILPLTPRLIILKKNFTVAKYA